jgi:adenosine deaminase
VFATTLSAEYHFVQEAFNLTLKQMMVLARQPINYIFASAEDKEAVQRLFDERLGSVNITLSAV